MHVLTVCTLYAAVTAVANGFLPPWHDVLAAAKTKNRVLALLPRSEFQEARDFFQVPEEARFFEEVISAETLEDLKRIEIPTSLLEKQQQALNENDEAPSARDDDDDDDALEFFPMVKEIETTALDMSRKSPGQGFSVTLRTLDRNNEEVGGVHGSTKSARNSLDTLAQRAEEEMLDEEMGIRRIELSGSRVRGQFGIEKPFRKSDVEMAFGLVPGQLGALREFLTQTLVPLKNMPTWFESYSPSLEYVVSEGDYQYKSLLRPGRQADKAYAIVIAGESGVGKSVSSCLMAKECLYDVVYCTVQSEDYENKPAKGNFESSRENLRRKTDLLPTEERDTSSIASCIHSVIASLNIGRDQWASSVLEKALNRTLNQNEVGKMWCQGDAPFHEPSCRPKKVAIILDEVTDEDLLRGLISTVRYERSKYLNRLAGVDLQIMLVGSGTDLVSVEGRAIGTNPACSRLITIKRPNVENLLKTGVISKPVYNAIYRGLFSRVMKDNSRMLFHSVLPILMNDMHEEDGGEFTEEERLFRLEERLSEIASFRPLMDHGARFYIGQNSIKQMEDMKRVSLLRAAFRLHLHSAMQAVQLQEGKERLQAELKAQLAELDFDPREAEDVFKYGLATRSVESSSAVKYLACFGLNCQLRPGFGSEFEELTALHYIRFCEVEGFQVKRVQLRHAWPPQAQEADCNLTKQYIADQAKNWENNKKSELVDFQVPSDVGKVCYVFSQGESTSQGADIMALRVDGDRVELVAIQCKHLKDLSEEDTLKKAWASLGIKFETRGRGRRLVGLHVVDPPVGMAGYSSKGLESFRALLEKRVKKEVVIRKRILAVSKPMLECPDRLVVTTDCKTTTVWCREMLEPTISTFRLREPTAEDDGFSL